MVTRLPLEQESPGSSPGRAVSVKWQKCDGCLRYPEKSQGVKAISCLKSAHLLKR